MERMITTFRLRWHLEKHTKAKEVYEPSFAKHNSKTLANQRSVMAIFLDIEKACDSQFNKGLCLPFTKQPLLEHGDFALSLAVELAELLDTAQRQSNSVERRYLLKHILGYC